MIRFPKKRTGIEKCRRKSTFPVKNRKDSFGFPCGNNSADSFFKRQNSLSGVVLCFFVKLPCDDIQKESIFTAAALFRQSCSAIQKSERVVFWQMMDLFNLIGSLFGYILWAAFFLVKNFGISIIIFTLIVKLLLLPFSVKQQRSMAANARFQKKQREIMERYGKDRMGAQMEIQKLMEKENISMMGGCLPMIAPMLVMLGVYYSVINPLTNTLHIASDKVNAAMNSIYALPGLGTSLSGNNYGQIYTVKYFNLLQDFFKDGSGNPLFSGSEADSINQFAGGFNFLGWDLLASPNASSFLSFMWLIPVLCFATSVVSMLIMQKMNGTQIKGCMLVFVFMMPMFSAWIAFNVPGAVGFYWIASTVLGFVQSLILNIFYNASIIEARDEAHRVVLRRQQEAEVAYIDVPDYVAPSEISRAKKEAGNVKYPEKKKKKRR